jgi:hypothetical protein
MLAAQVSSETASSGTVMVPLTARSPLSRVYIGLVIVAAHTRSGPKLKASPEDGRSIGTVVGVRANDTLTSGSIEARRASEGGGADESLATRVHVAVQAISLPAG